MRREIRSALMLGAALGLVVSCSDGFDQTRPPPPETTLGEDIYSTVCDRLGATVFTEDRTGESYQAVCHPDKDGKWGDTVDETKLPPVGGAAALSRAASLAEMNALVRRRADLVRALDATFDKTELPVPFGETGETIDSHQALSELMKALVPIYEANPIDEPAKEPLVPSATRAIGRLFAGLAGPGGDPTTSAADAAKAKLAREAMARIAGRQGYRPSSLVLGAIRPMLAYPSLRQFVQALGPLLEPGGSLRAPLQTVLGMAQNELETSVPSPLPPAYRLVDVATLQPNRPRTKLEIAAATMLAEDPAFLAVGSEPRYLVERDVRGVAVPAGNTPGTPGSVSAPFVDSDGDGYADVDGFGRFLGASGALAQIDPPFVIPGLARITSPDPYGRALDGSGQPLFQYHDANQALISALFRDLDPLLDTDPATQHETVADLLAGAFELYGDQISENAAWAPGGQYLRFDASRSPIVDLLYGFSQLLADKNSDAVLALLQKLVVEHEDLVARLLGVALEIREFSNQHPEASLDPSDTFWDEFAEIVVKLTDDPALFKDVLRAFSAPALQADFGHAMATLAKYRDRYTYDPADLNGPTLNLTAGGGSTADPSFLVDRTKPDVGDNMSALHVALQAIHDVSGASACNKAGAKVQMKLLGMNLSWPLFGSYKECELLVFDDIGVLYLKSVLCAATKDPAACKDAKLPIRADGLNALLGIANTLGINVDELLEQTSGVRGLTQTPNPPAMNRLVFFGATGSKYGPLKDDDPLAGSTNKDTQNFISSLIDPVSTVLCPLRDVQDPLGKLGTIRIPDCKLSSSDDLLRIRDQGSIFSWETRDHANFKFDFYGSLAPLIKAFNDHDANKLLLEMMDVLYRHWSTAAHGPECTKTGTWKRGEPGYNPKYCAESGLSRYEPILIKAFESDLLPAIGELVKVVDGMTVVDARGGNAPRSGLDLLHDAAVLLFDPKHAASVGLVSRDGKTATTWADGKTPKPQVALFDLFAQAMRGIDLRLEGKPVHARWRRARSQLVDQFLGIDGTGASAKFRDRAIPKALPILLSVLREQLNANCPEREATGACPWANDADPSKTMWKRAQQTFEEPMFSTTMNLLHEVDPNDDARREVMKLLRYLIVPSSSNNAQTSTLTSLSDMMQLLGDEENMPPIYNAIAMAAAPTETEADGQPAPGAVDRTLALVRALTNERAADGSPQPNPYDRYHIVDRILKNLVTPMDPKDPLSQTPIEVILDVVSEVNRLNADLTASAPLDAGDYEMVFRVVRDFMTSRTRGMEQLYEIVRHRNGD